MFFLPSILIAYSISMIHCLKNNFSILNYMQDILLYQDMFALMCHYYMLHRSSHFSTNTSEIKSHISFPFWFLIFFVSSSDDYSTIGFYFCCYTHYYHLFIKSRNRPFIPVLLSFPLKISAITKNKLFNDKSFSLLS